MMQEFSIWSEGYSATCECAPAMFHGRVKASTFRDACDEYFKDNEYYDSENLSLLLWGCRLFDNETDARKAFG